MNQPEKSRIPALPPSETGGMLKATLTLRDAIALIIGVMVGAGIFETPALVAANLGSATATLLTWLVGGGMCRSWERSALLNWPPPTPTAAATTTSRPEVPEVPTPGEGT